MNRAAFFSLHADLPREGPGSREDLDWAVKLARLPDDARFLDAGCGPGADIAGLLDHAPDGSVIAIDTHPPFIDKVQANWSDDPRVTAIVGDMRHVVGTYDFIWCAGALYFLGVEDGLGILGARLALNGAIAFSDLVYLVNNPAPDLRAAIQPEYPTIGTRTALRDRIADAGFALLGQRVLSDAAWEAYYTPMEARIAALRPGADADLAKVLDEADAEIALWRKYRHQFGYALSVVRPE